MHRVLTRSILAGTLAATLLTGTALGHECFVASRSDTGDIKAGSHAKVWFTVASLSGLFELAGAEILQEDPLSEAQMDWAVEQGLAAGMPAQFTIFIGAKTIAEGTPAMDRHGANGKGIDHAFDWLPVVAEIYMAALQQ
jgi:hypothetical protein